MDQINCSFRPSREVAWPLFVEPAAEPDKESEVGVVEFALSPVISDSDSDQFVTAGGLLRPPLDVLGSGVDDFDLGPPRNQGRPWSANIWRTPLCVAVAAPHISQQRTVPKTSQL